jgi:hypothetical protein
MKNQLTIYFVFIIVVLAAQGCKKDWFADKTAADNNSALSPFALSGIYVSTFAGNLEARFVDEPGNIARFSASMGITTPEDFLYLVDQASAIKRKVTLTYA